MRANSADNATTGDDTGWVNIFGLPIPFPRLRWHFWSFSVSVVAATAFGVAARLAAPDPVSECVAAYKTLQWHQIPSLATADIIPTVIFCGVFSPIVVEAIAMVIAAYYTRSKLRKGREELLKAGREGREEGREEGRAQGQAEGRAQGQAEGRAEANAAWRAWYQRRLAAEAADVPFDEPPPDFNHAGNGQED